MPTIAGHLKATAFTLPRQHALGLLVRAVDQATGEVVATCTLGDFDDFALEVESEAAMKLEISTALPGVEPLVLDYNGTDAEVFLYYENTQTSRL